MLFEELVEHVAPAGSFTADIQQDAFSGLLGFGSFSEHRIPISRSQFLMSGILSQSRASQ